MNFDELVAARMSEQLITHPKYGGVYRLCEPVEGKKPDGAWVMGMVYQDVDTLTKYWRPITMFNKFKLWEVLSHIKGECILDDSRELRGLTSPVETFSGTGPIIF